MSLNLLLIVSAHVKQPAMDHAKVRVRDLLQAVVEMAARVVQAVLVEIHVVAHAHTNVCKTVIILVCRNVEDVTVHVILAVKKVAMAAVLQLVL